MQIRVLRFVAAWWHVEKTAPRIRDVAWHLNKSYSTANFHIKDLITKDMLTRIAGKHRSLTITDKGKKAIGAATERQIGRKSSKTNWTKIIKEM